MQPGDKVVYYIVDIHKFGAIANITGKYYEDHTKVWTDKKEMWPSRCSSEPVYVLEDDELLDAKKLLKDLSFIEKKEIWGVYFQGSIKQIPEEDFKLIESEIKNIVQARPGGLGKVTLKKVMRTDPRSESEVEVAIKALPLQRTSLHDRLCEMLEQIGSWMKYNTQIRHKIAPDHAYELDVAWLTGRNPEIAIEVHVSGNLTEAKDRLTQARKFNYRKVIIILSTSDLGRLNSLIRHEPELRSWMEAWSFGAVYKMNMAGEKFFNYYKQLEESIYKNKSHLDLIE